MTKAIAYLRVSTDKQADHGVSLDVQRAKVEAYASLYDLELVGVEVDAGESAKSLDRPGLKSALQRMRKGEAEALIVVKLDRLTRSVADLCTLLEKYFTKKYTLLSVGEQIDTRTAAGRLVLNILATVGQWERETIGERTSVAMRHMRNEGRYTGGVAPYGYSLSDEGVLLTNSQEQEVIAHARGMRARGMSLRAIASTLDEQGKRSRSGTAFAASAIAKMIGVGVAS